MDGKIEGYATIAALVCIVTAIAADESGKYFGFVMGVIGFWCFGIKVVYEFWHLDKHGDSKIRAASMVVQVTEISQVDEDALFSNTNSFRPSDGVELGPYFNKIDNRMTLVICIEP